MDGPRFDDLTKALAVGRPRRAVLRGLGAGALALAATALGGGGAGAAPGDNQGGGPRPGRCGQVGHPCKFGRHCCSETCLNGYCACPPATPNLCPGTGACLPACPTGRVFDAATCACECVETTCCLCHVDNGGGFCSDAFADYAACNTACLAAGVAGGGFMMFRGGPGKAYACTATGQGCVQTCPETP